MSINSGARRFWRPFRLAYLELAHGWKHFSVFLSCLLLGVTIMAAVNTLGSVIQKSLTQEAQSLLGGDLEIRVRGVKPTPEQELFFQRYGKVSSVATLRSMMHFNEASTLIELKAVDAHYPLLGSLLLQGAPNQSQVNQSQQGENLSSDVVFEGNGIAVDPLLLSQLDLKLGDQVKIGQSTYRVRATIQREPDRAVQIFNFGPRVMMSQASLDASGLVTTFSLVEHRYRVVTPQGVLANDASEKQIENELREAFPEMSWRVRTGADGNQSLERFLNQLIAFMNLSGLATFLIAGIGIGSSVRTYLEKKSSTIAVLKVQGATQGLVLQTYLCVIGFLSVIGGIAGILVAALVTSALMPLLAQVLPSIAGESGLYLPASLLALWYGVLIAYLFSIPALLSAVTVKPAILFRSKTSVLVLSASRLSNSLVFLLVVLLFGTLFYNASDKGMILGTLIGVCIAFMLFGFCTYLIKKATRKVQLLSVFKTQAPWLKLALNNIHRPGSSAGTVVFATGLSLTVLIALTLTEANFQTRIQKIAENQAPSLFMIDIQPHQKSEIKKLLLEFAESSQITISPMVRGRITHLAGKPVSEVKVLEDISWALRGDRGISYSAVAPKNANIIQGDWWPSDYVGEPLLSVDERFLDGMGLEIGDSMSVSILGEEITAQIANARRIDYSSFQLNFAMMLSPGTLEEFPHTSLATVYLDKELNLETELVKRIAHDFPGVTAIRTEEVIGLVQTVMGHIATALRVTVGISLLAGLLVLSSALSATIRQRIYDVAILKVLGASRSDILKSCSAEWLLLALTTSGVAAVLGTCAAAFIHARLKGQEFAAMPEIIALIIGICMVVIWGIGFLGNRALFSFRPGVVLRNE